jgi:hypothetical protein
MHRRRRDAIEDFLVVTAGPWLPAAIDFAWKTLLGLAAIPLALIAFMGLKVFRWILRLHDFGERTQNAISLFINPRRDA